MKSKVFNVEYFIYINCDLISLNATLHCCTKYNYRSLTGPGPTSDNTEAEAVGDVDNGAAGTRGAEDDDEEPLEPEVTYASDSDDGGFFDPPL